MNPSEYLKWIESHQIPPNFWMSEEYITKKELFWSCGETVKGWKETPESEEWFFPPSVSTFLFDGMISYKHGDIFAGFALSASNCGNAIFLDYQFLYNPKDFLEMKGHKWATFRKNSRKYPKRTSSNLFYRDLNDLSNFDWTPSELNSDIDELCMNWSERKNHNIHDPELLVKYLYQGEHRKGLFDGDVLVGINVWDENFQFINFRYCIDDGEPFLNEYMRYLFYTDPEIQAKNKLVNDGGALDSKGLKKFKKKLNPTSILKVYSYKKGENIES